MLFSIIYSVDCPSGTGIADFAPPVLDLFDETEDDDQFDYGYLEGEWENGHHRKWCGILNREQFDAFLERTGLFAEDVETMGSLGAPGCGFGWAPAISFTNDAPKAIQAAYVTPMPDNKRESLCEDDWKRIRAAVLAVY